MGVIPQVSLTSLSNRPGLVRVRGSPQYGGTHMHHKLSRTTKRIEMARGANPSFYPMCQYTPEGGRR